MIISRFRHFMRYRNDGNVEVEPMESNTNPTLLPSLVDLSRKSFIRDLSPKVTNRHDFYGLRLLMAL